MIDRTHRLAVTRQAALLGLSRASVYYTPCAVPATDLAVMRRIDALHLELPFTGSRMLRDLLRGEGYVIGRDHVRTLMRRMGIAAVYRRPRSSSQRHPAHPVFPYLLRTLTIDRPNQVWAADITYIPMARGFVFLVAIMDWATRKVLAWRVSTTLASDCCVAALEDALARFGTPEIFNTDQGAQFTSADFLGVLRAHQIQISMDGRGCWRDNVLIERLWRSVKYEEVYLRAYETVSEVRAGLERYFTFFNRRRPHQALRRRTPDAVYFASRPHEAVASPCGTVLIPAA
jgi:putative transposase